MLTPEKNPLPGRRNGTKRTLVLLEVARRLKAATTLNLAVDRYKVGAIGEARIMRTDWKSIVLAFALLAPASIASAQWDASTQTGTSTSAATAPTPPPAPPDQMVSDTPPVEAPKKKPLEVGFTWSLDIGVPIILDVPREVVRPGANLFFFGGADFGFFIVGGSAGLQWNPIDLNGQVINGSVLSGRSPLTRIHLTVPEVRFQVPDLKVALPYLGFAFDMNFWNFQETAVGCGYWYCSQYSVYRFTPGFTGRAGVAMNIKESGVHIDVGFQYSFTGKGNFFDQTGWWLSPYVGVLVRRR
jgi:hypothetical protein